MSEYYKIVGCAIDQCGGLCCECGNEFDDDGCKTAATHKNFYYLYKKEKV